MHVAVKVRVHVTVGVNVRPSWPAGGSRQTSEGQNYRVPTLDIICAVSPATMGSATLLATRTRVNRVP